MSETTPNFHFSSIQPESSPAKPAARKKAVAVQAVAAAAPSIQAPSEGAAILAMIDRLIANPDMPVERLEQAFALYQRVQTDQSRRSYFAAMSELQADLPTVVALGKITGEEKGSGAKIVRSKYAKWEDVNETIRPALCTHGFALSFRITQPQPDRVMVTAVLSHRDGHAEETSLHLPNDPSGGKNNVQAWGSSVSYGKRYTAFALLNIAARGEDDDATGAGPVNNTLISEEQEMALRDKIESVDADAKKFCAYFRIAKLADLKTSDLGRAMAALDKKASAR